MSNTTDFTKLFADTILKKLVVKIESDRKKKTIATERSMETAKTAADVRTSRHWRAAGDIEFYYEEEVKGFERLKELDELTGWSEKLDQDRFKFMLNKHKTILDDYLRISYNS